MLKDGGRWSGARRGPFFVGAWCEVFHSTRTSPTSVVGQYGDIVGPLFVDRGAQQGRGKKKRGGGPFGQVAYRGGRQSQADGKDFAFAVRRADGKKERALTYS